MAAPPSAPALTLAELGRPGVMVRGWRGAAADFVPPVGARWEVAIPPDGAELVCYQDLAPWNLIRDGGTWTFVDGDASAPGTRLWDWPARSAESAAGDATA